MKLTLEQANRLMNKNGGSLDLRGTGITSLPDGLSVGGFLDLHNTGITTLPDGLTVGGYLDLNGTNITSLPNDLSVGGSLYLRDTSITTLPDGLTIGGSLDLCDTDIAALPEGLSVGGYLDLRGTNITSLPDGLSVGGFLDLYGTGITSLPDGLTVGSHLNLRDTSITTLPDGLTIGGSLDLRGTGITTLPDSLSVGGSIFPGGKDIPTKNVHRLKDGDYVPGRYIWADGILTLVRGERHLDGYTVYIGKIKGRNVISDGKRYAHCDKIRDGIADLIFKAAADRGAGQYRDISLDTEMGVEEAKTMYRVITGACRQGTENFVVHLGDKLKERYTVREMLELTRGQYGSEKFREFFEQ